MTSTLVCDVCPRGCKLEEGETGFCNVRKNVNGENVDALYGLFYPYPNNPPECYIPLFPGCNLKCWFCFVPFTSAGFTGDACQRISPTELVERAKVRIGPMRQEGMGDFGGEPCLHHEFILELARLCREQHVPTCLYTNGFINEWVIQRLTRVVDKVSIGIKASGSPIAYARMNASPDQVFETIRIAWENCPNVWVRDLVGPGLIPSDEDIGNFAKWILDKTDQDICIVIDWLLQPTSSIRELATDGPQLSGLPGDTPELRYKRCSRVAFTLTDKYGIANVWIPDPRFSNVLVQVPNMTPLPLGDNNPKVRPQNWSRLRT